MSKQEVINMIKQLSKDQLKKLDVILQTGKYLTFLQESEARSQKPGVRSQKEVKGLLIKDASHLLLTTGS